MKQKARYLGWFIPLLLLGISACQSPEDEIPLERAATAARMVVKLEQVPRLSEYLQEGLGLNEDAQLFSVNHGGNRLPLEIDWEQIYQLVDAQGKETYTFRITDHDGDIATFYNLVLKVSENGEPQPPFLMKYTMAEDFVATYLATGSLEGFTGTRQRIYLTAAGTANNGGSRAWLDNTLVGSGIIANPCPKQNLGGGSSSGDTGQGSICRTYEVTTLWYSQTVGHPPVLVDVTVTYRTECGSGESTAAGVSRDCRPEDEEIPAIEPDLDKLADQWENEICEKKNFQENTCLQEVWNVMKELNVGYETVTNFKRRAPSAKLCLDLKPLGDKVNGNASLNGTISNANVTVNVNSDKLAGRPKLSIARTILHELIHAELHAMIIQAGGYEHFKEFAQNYQGEDSFKTIWKYYEEHGRFVSGRSTGWQHEFMADYYIEFMAKGLKKLHPELSTVTFINYFTGSNFTIPGSPVMRDWVWDDFFTALAWSGLEETTAYEGLDETTKKLYEYYIGEQDIEVSAAKCN